MAGYVQAVAVDLDGTLTSNDRLSETVTAALDECVDTGVSVIVVTGRIREELHRQLPDLAAHVTALVYENGAVLEADGQLRNLAEPVDPVLVEALRGRGIQLRQGRVIVACHGADTATITDQINRLGLDEQVVRNRSEAMVLPAGVSKGSGLRAVLDQPNLSAHNTVAIGDAENDLAMLEVAEVGVAVANAVDSVRRHADLVLTAENGRGVAEFLRGPVIAGGQVISPARHRVRIGQTTTGAEVSVPGAQSNILISGGAGTGKSYLTGLLVERWIEAGYTVLVIDPEGDHAALSHLRATLVIDASAPDSTRELSQVLRQRSASVVLDLSMLEADRRLDYIGGIAADLEEVRSLHGLPHWVVVDEAHGPLGERGPIAHFIRPSGGGYCFVTYQPELLCEAATASVELSLTPLVHDTSATNPGPAMALWRERNAAEITVELDHRVTPHVRHRHKYASGPMPDQHRFRFRSATDQEISAAGSLEEFTAQLRSAPADVVERHALNRDFSRWVLDVLQDRELGAVLAGAENTLVARHANDLWRFQRDVLAEIDERYLEGAAARGAGPADMV